MKCKDKLHGNDDAKLWGFCGKTRHSVMNVAKLVYAGFYKIDDSFAVSVCYSIIIVSLGLPYQFDLSGLSFSKGEVLLWCGIIYQNTPEYWLIFLS